eukprot:2363516-Lingulodinium_polyedra.AAC.1
MACFSSNALARPAPSLAKRRARLLKMPAGRRLRVTRRTLTSARPTGKTPRQTHQLEEGARNLQRVVAHKRVVARMPP